MFQVALTEKIGHPKFDPSDIPGLPSGVIKHGWKTMEVQDSVDDFPAGHV